MPDGKHDTDQLDLTEVRGLRSLLGVSTRVWLTHPAVFISVALIVVLPVELILVGLIGGGFSDPYGEADRTVDAIDTFVINTVLTALITACHARTVVLIASGQPITLGRAVRNGFAAFLPVLLTGVVVGLLTGIGYIFFLVPGIFLSIALLFSTQFVALSRTSTGNAIEASMALVSANGWWRTLGYNLVLILVPLVVVVIGSAGVVVVADAAGDPKSFGIVAVIVTALVEAVFLSWTALVGTLLYFSWRARAGDPYGEPETERSALLADAGPDWKPAPSS